MKTKEKKTYATKPPKNATGPPPIKRILRWQESNSEVRDDGGVCEVGDIDVVVAIGGEATATATNNEGGATTLAVVVAGVDVVWDDDNGGEEEVEDNEAAGVGEVGEVVVIVLFFVEVNDFI